MSRAVDNIPAETDLLCQRCGYILSGLDDSNACPECGKPIMESIRPDLRQPTVWEEDPKHRSRLARLFITSAQIIFHPERFYQSFVTRSELQGPRLFARIQRLIASAILGLGIAVHQAWFNADINVGKLLLLYLALIWPIAIACIWLGLTFTTRIAGSLTAWEAKMRGYRLPARAVSRGLDYHTAHLQPVALLISATMIANYLLTVQGLLNPLYGPMYLYVLCGEVIAAAVYLFLTYWTAMRSMLYANR